MTPEILARCVKGQEWTADGPDRLVAPMGYSIETDGPWFRCFGLHEIRKRPEYSPWPTLEAAKAAAQADYTARILAALDLDAIRAEVEAMVEAEQNRCIAVVRADAHYLHADRIATAIRNRKGRSGA